MLNNIVIVQFPQPISNYLPLKRWFIVTIKFFIVIQENTNWDNNNIINVKLFVKWHEIIKESNK